MTRWPSTGDYGEEWCGWGKRVRQERTSIGMTLEGLGELVGERTDAYRSVCLKFELHAANCQAEADRLRLMAVQADNTVKRLKANLHAITPPSILPVIGGALGSMLTGMDEQSIEHEQLRQEVEFMQQQRAQATRSGVQQP